jgi:recombinational DNA repair protein (RecF pathway)
MSHELIITPAFILKHSNVGEADKLYYLYTREKGRITARATGVRLLKSKLRYILQLESLIKVSLIMGRSGYRLINAIPMHAELYNSYPLAKRSLIFLLDRLVQGEEKNSDLFDALYNVLLFNDDHASSLHIEKSLYGLGALILLSHLGYYSSSDHDIVNLMTSSVITVDMLNEFNEKLPHSSELIRSLITSTQL